MTIGPTDTLDPEATEKLLASMAQQVAQQSRTTALHISQHDDIEAAAQERANAVIEGIRADLEAAHQAALARATEAMTASHRAELHQNLTAIAERFNGTLQELTDQHAGILKGHVDALEELGKQNSERHGQEVEELRAEIQTSREQAQRQRQEMDEAHAANLAAADSALRQEREEQQRQYRETCSRTTAEVRGLLEAALEENTRDTDRKLEEAGAALARQGRDVREALAASNARWRRLSIILAGATAMATAVAVAALVMALL
jgi:hypothetical protein